MRGIFIASAILCFVVLIEAVAAVIAGMIVDGRTLTDMAKDAMNALDLVRERKRRRKRQKEKERLAKEFLGKSFNFSVTDEISFEASTKADPEESGTEE